MPILLCNARMANSSAVSAVLEGKGYPRCIQDRTHTVNSVKANLVLCQPEDDNCRDEGIMPESTTSAWLLAAATRLLY